MMVMRSLVIFLLLWPRRLPKQESVRARRRLEQLTWVVAARTAPIAGARDWSYQLLVVWAARGRDHWEPLSQVRSLLARSRQLLDDSVSSEIVVAFLGAGWRAPRPWGGRSSQAALEANPSCGYLSCGRAAGTTSARGSIGADLRDGATRAGGGVIRARGVVLHLSV